jgi:hypothetical protein
MEFYKLCMEIYKKEKSRSLRERNGANGGKLNMRIPSLKTKLLFVKQG